MDTLWAAAVYAAAFINHINVWLCAMLQLMAAVGVLLSLFFIIFSSQE